MVAVKGDSGKEILNTAAQDSVSGFVDDDLSQSEGSDSDYELPESASTPNLKEAVDLIKRSVSLSSLQNISSGPHSEVRRQIQKKLWRPQDDEAKIPTDWERLMIHVIRGASRAFTLAYGLRGSINFLFVIVKALRSRKPINKSDLKIAFTSEATIRFALCFGIWASIFKFTNNALRLVTPRHIKPRNANRRSAHNTPEPTMRIEKDGNLTLAARQNNERRKSEWKHISSLDPRSRKWHAYLAGAVSSMAFVVMKRDFVRSLGTHLFVRGLEGTCRMANRAGYLYVPYGSVLVFGLANVQIILSWLGAPEYLERSYKAWIDKASGLSPEILRSYTLSLTLGGPSPWDLVHLMGGEIPKPISTNPLKFSDVPPNAVAPLGVSGEMIRRIYRWCDDGNPPRFPTCGLHHMYTTNHFVSTVRNYWILWKFVIPVYLTLYFVPLVFLRPKLLLKTPLLTSVRTLLAATRSSAFLATYGLIVKSAFCILYASADGITHSWLKNYAVMRRLSNLLVDHRMMGLAGFLSCLSLFVEHHRRRNELTMYVLPKALESFWKSGRARGIFPRVPMGDYILAAAGLSMIMGTYAENPQNLSKIVSLVLYQFLGRN